jgi:hypothetical protein
MNGQQLSGEKIKLNHHGSNDKLPTYSGSYIPSNEPRDQQ